MIKSLPQKADLILLLALAIWGIGLRLFASSWADSVIGYTLLYLLLITVLSFIPKKLNETAFNQYFLFINLFIFTAIILKTEPIFENDHLRYIWEGKVTSQGLSPYKMSPSSPHLSSIFFEKKEYIAFSELTSPYSPLAHYFFSIFSNFSYINTLACLQISFMLIFYYLLLKIGQSGFRFTLITTSQLIIIYTKEFIQSIHVDLIAFLFFFIALLCLKKQRLRWGLMFFLLSLFFKLTAIIFLPIIFIFIWRSAHDKWTSLLSWAIAIIFCLAFFQHLGLWNTGVQNGLNAFVNRWAWNSGFLNILILINLPKNIIHLIDYAFLAVFYTWTLWKASRSQFQNFNIFINYLLQTMLIFSFFFPVYNPWYTIWFSFFAVTLQNQFAVLYAIFSSLGYLIFYFPTFGPLISLATHVWFFPAYIKSYTGNKYAPL